LLLPEHRVAKLPVAGRCSSCGYPSLFIRYQDPRADELFATWPYPDRYIRSIASRENYFCVWCRRNYRTRMLGSIVRRYIGGATVYEAATSTALADRMRRAAVRYETSEYLDGVTPGDIVHGVRNEDLQRLTWPSSSFDVVVTSEVFEHIDDPWRAFAEVRRVLRTGGRHIFTVPDHDDRTTATRDDSMPRVAHLDGLRAEGIEVRTDFGTDLPQLLEAYGFRSSVHAFPKGSPITRVFEALAV
jgi:SAM-dependent methyltransferase